MKKEFIPGIYNYCDRWCERCRLADRCRVYNEEINAKSALPSPEKAKESVANIEEELKKAIDLLQKMVEERGIVDIEMPEANVLDDLTEQKSQTLEQKTKAYIKLVDKWFKNNKTFFSEKEEELSQRISLDLKVNEEALDLINEAFERIRWYQVFISAKIHRSLSGLKLEDFDEIHITQNDSNGSAKIALIAIEKSIAAWETIRIYFPEKTDELIDIFVLLHKVQDDLREIFPQAMQFIRPGFDDVMV